MTAASPSTPSASMDRLLADLLERATREIRAGKPLDLDALVAEFPEQAEQLRPLLPAVQLLADLSRSADAGEFPGGIATKDGSLDGTLGDFRILREVGRGGMGIVYEAEQISLNRRVALKVLPFAATMDPRQLQRFRNEAQAAACLHHPNIVPVHGVGVERGVHYYAMQLIEGQTLAEVISGRVSQRERDVEDSHVALTPRRSPSTAAIAALTTKRDRAHFRHIASLIASAADALEYAHSMGVVHRDIKPGNLMLDFSPSPLAGEGWGGGSHLWITDFGLAKLASPGREAGEITLTGDLIGTLRYMSPEQALAKHGLVDHRTDIYSLGATLYELLTLKPAVPGDDKGEILKAIAWDDPTPLRKLDKSIPAELETITLKCLAKEPGERYAMAGEMADDLLKWLADKPIHAKPPAWRERAAKWARRHPGVAATVAVSTFLLLVVVIAGLLVNNWLIRQEQEKTRTALDAAAKSRAQARESFDQLTSDVIGDWLTQKPRLSANQKKVLELALARFEEFAREPGATPIERFALARACWRVADFRAWLGMRAESEKSYARSAEIYDALRKEFPNELKYASELAKVHINWSASLQKFGLHPESLGQCQAACLVLEALVQISPGVPEYMIDLGGSYCNIGHAIDAAGDPRSALVWYDKSIAVLEPIGRTRDSNLAYGRLFLSNAHEGRAEVLADLEEWEAALASMGAARVLKELLVAENANDPTYLRELASTDHIRAKLLAKLSKPEEALTCLEVSRALRERLVQEHGAVSQFVDDLANTCDLMADLQDELRHPADALKSLTVSLTLRERLMQAREAIPAYVASLARTQSKLAFLEGRLGHREEARRLYEAALSVQERLVREHPTDSAFAVALGGTYCNLGSLLRTDGKVKAALASFRHAIETLEPMTRITPPPANACAFLCNSYWNRSIAYGTLGRQSEALDDLDRTIVLDKSDYPVFRLRRAATLALLGKHVEAITTADEFATRRGLHAGAAYDLACVYSLCAAAVAKSEGLPPADRAQLAEKYIQRAVAALHQAVEVGYRDLAHMKQDADLDPLRQHEKFKKLIGELEAKE